MNKNDNTVVFNHEFLTLSPRLTMAFLNLKVPKVLEEKMTEEKWYILNFSEEVRKELGYKKVGHKKETDFYIRKLIRYKTYLYRER